MESRELQCCPWRLHPGRLLPPSSTSTLTPPQGSCTSRGSDPASEPRQESGVFVVQPTTTTYTTRHTSMLTHTLPIVWIHTNPRDVQRSPCTPMQCTSPSTRDRRRLIKFSSESTPDPTILRPSLLLPPFAQHQPSQ